MYYPIPKNGHVRNKIKEELKWGLDRKSKSDKQRDFLLWSEEVSILHIQGVHVFIYVLFSTILFDWLYWERAGIEEVPHFLLTIYHLVTFLPIDCAGYGTPEAL